MIRETVMSVCLCEHTTSTRLKVQKVFQWSRHPATFRIHQALRETLLAPEGEADVRTPYLNDSEDGHLLNPDPPAPPLPILQPSLSSPGHHPHHMFPQVAITTSSLAACLPTSFVSFIYIFFFPFCWQPGWFSLRQCRLRCVSSVMNREEADNNSKKKKGTCLRWEVTEPIVNPVNHSLDRSGTLWATWVGTWLNQLILWTSCLGIWHVEPVRLTRVW